jgi:hypothetical protein
MVRRSTVDRSPQSAVYGADLATETGELTQGGGTARRTARGWSGAGGRWLVWLLRVVVWVVLLVIGYNGVMAIVAREKGSSPAPAATAAAGATFPDSLADAYALAFGQVYLNASPAGAGQRASALAAYLPAGLSSQLGWNGTGSLQLQSEQVAGIAVRDAHHAVVTLLARVNGRLMELGVPIYYHAGALAVSGEPAWLPGPARASLPAPAQPGSDAAVQAQLASQLPAFFQAYASGNQVTLGRFLLPGTHLPGLAGQVTFGSLTSVTVPPGGAVRHIAATVVWNVPSQAAASRAAAASGAVGAAHAGLEMSYALTVVKQNGTWYISQIGPSFQAAGQS